MKGEYDDALVPKRLESQDETGSKKGETARLSPWLSPDVWSPVVLMMGLLGIEHILYRIYEF